MITNYNNFINKRLNEEKEFGSNKNQMIKH